MYIVELWKEENLIDIAAPSYITLNVAIKNKDSFKKIINNIKKVNSVDSFLIESFDDSSAKIKVKFYGKVKSLQNNLVESGFEVQFSNKQWNLKLIK